MEPLSSYAVASIASAVSNLWSSWRARKQAIIIEDKKAEEKRKSDKEAYERLKESQAKAHERAEIIQKNNFDNSKKQIEYKANYDTSQIWAERGELLNTIRPNEKRPIVIFDTIIRNNTTKKEEVFTFNPMESLYHSFENQINLYLPNEVYITNISKDFKSQSAVEAFYNDELYDLPAIIIYGSFDGNFLRINSMYAGMTIEQHSFDNQFQPQILPKSPSHLCLAEIPFSIISRKLDNEKVTSEKFLLREQIQKYLLDLISNSSIQALIDSHFSIYRNIYLPIVGKKKNIEELEKLEIGLETEDYKKSIENHSKMSLEQRDKIQSLRNSYLKEYFKNNKL